MKDGPTSYQLPSSRAGGSRLRMSAPDRAKKFIETGDKSFLGVGLTRTMANIYLPSDMIKAHRDVTATGDDYVQDRSEYRKPKGFSTAQQAKRQALIKDIQDLTGDKNYDGTGKRLKVEEESHRWHNVKGGATPARLSHSMLHGHGHY